MVSLLPPNPECWVNMCCWDGSQLNRAGTYELTFTVPMRPGVATCEVSLRFEKEQPIDGQLLMSHVGVSLQMNPHWDPILGGDGIVDMRELVDPAQFLCALELDDSSPRWSD